MHRTEGRIGLSATDLSSFFECEHRTTLDLAVLNRNLTRPGTSELERRIRQHRGREHEARVLRFYRDQGLEVEDILGGGGRASEEDATTRTLAAMERGVDVIYQGHLTNGSWVGHPDFLVRVAVSLQQSSRFGSHVYEPVDAKLAREEKARAVLQLCTYADQLRVIQGNLPGRMWLALGTTDIAPVALNTAEYIAYFNRAKGGLEAFVEEPPVDEPYPEPVEFCDVCEWWQRCEARRRADDHLSLVAGITRRQRSRLEQAGIRQLVQLATLHKEREVSGIDTGPLGRIRHQAQLQHEGRTKGAPVYSLMLDVDAGCGLECLPEPKPGDLFLDLEGDAFVGDGGLEYLFGLLELGEPSLDWVSRDEPGAPQYHAHWATNPVEEKAAFEAVVDRIRRGREEFRDMHVFHFGHRETDAIKKLSCKHATREDDIDEFLRAGVFVDLHTVVRQSLRASVEAYTLKDLEVLHGFKRAVSRRESACAMQLFGWWLESREGDDQAALQQTLAQYNEEDCRSTWQLRDWLEARRLELHNQLGRPLGRPKPVPDDNSDVEPKNAEAERVAIELRRGLPPNLAHDTPEQGAKRLLADLVGWHWRELKSSYWEYYEAKGLPRTEWLESRFVLDGLSNPMIVGEVKQSNIYRYSFPEQEHAIRKFPLPEVAGTDGKKATVVEIGPDYIDIKRGKRSKETHPTALRPGRPKASNDQAAQLLAIAKSVAAKGFEGNVEYAVALDLLLRRPPKCGQALGAPLVSNTEDTVAAVKRLCLALDHSKLAIQGPPGSGKTFRATGAILALVRAGRRVGVTANSHQVITSLLVKVHNAASMQQVPIAIQHICDPGRFEEQPLPFAVDNDYQEAANRIASGEVQLMGGTTFAWAKASLRASVDVLFVEEAGQLSLANVLAVSPATKSLVLLGDPAQLEQPQKGTHPGGADVSSLEYVLGDAITMPPDLGVFLSESRRLHPDICAFTSRIFYEGRLKSLPGLEQQRINGPEPFSGSGLRYVPVKHTGNTNRSDEEVERIAAIVNQLFAAGATFQGKDGGVRPLRIGSDEKRDVLVVAPYNAQVVALEKVLPLDRVAIGTVDRFQGNEAPIVIYSMTTSSGDEAPRGLEFLFSLNRFNVATSRAQALVILVASPALVRARCRTPRQLKLVNALCAYLEQAGEEMDQRGRA